MQGGSIDGGDTEPRGERKQSVLAVWTQGDCWLVEGNENVLDMKGQGHEEFALYLCIP